MNKKTIVSLFVAVFALLLVAPVNAGFTYIESDSVILNQNSILSVNPGQTLDLRVVFQADGNAPDARVTARILGEPGSYEATERFDVFAGQTYSKWLQLEVPSNVDPQENFILEVRVEGQSQQVAVLSVLLAVQRENYALQFLSIDSNSIIEAGKVLPVEVVIENNGLRIAEDTFVEARIPELGISKRIFLEDLSAIDSTDEDLKDDALEGTILLPIPAHAAPGIYTVELRAYNDDSEVTSTRRVQIVSGQSSSIVTSGSRKTFAANSDGMYTLTIVNSGNNILVYNLVTESDSGLTVDLEESVVVVPAGSSKSVKVNARSSENGEYNFKVLALNADNVVVSEHGFTANVEGRSTVGGNAAVVLTIILAIVFVVLLVVLIVLLTRKPAKTDELGESYY